MEMVIVPPPGETWDADGNEEALVRTPHGFATYSMRKFKVVTPEPQPKLEPQPEPKSQPEPRPKKKHKKFTSPAPDIGDEGVNAYQEKLKGLLDDALPVSRASMASPQPEVKEERDGVQKYEDALKTLADTTPSQPSRDSMAPPPRPVRRQEGQDTPEPSQALMPPSPRPRKREARKDTPEPSRTLMPPPPWLERRQEKQDTPEPERRQERQDSPRPEWESEWESEGLTEKLYKRNYRWKFARRIGDDYIPTARELAKVNTMPKRPSPLSQVHNIDSDISTTPSPSPPHSPRLRPNAVSNIHQRTPDGRRRYMEWLNTKPPCRPRAGDKELHIGYRAPQKRQEKPKRVVPAPAYSPQDKPERIWRWQKLDLAPAHTPLDDYERIWRWERFGRRNCPTTRELAQVILWPKSPSRLSQVHNADSDTSTTPTSSPPHSPRLRPRTNTVANNFRSFEDTLRHMEDLDDKPARDRCLPRAGDPDLTIVYRAPPEREVKIIGWQLSNELRDVSYLVQLVGSPSTPL
jgi:hypothetical protein